MPLIWPTMQDMLVTLPSIEQDELLALTAPADRRGERDTTSPP